MSTLALLQEWYLFTFWMWFALRWRIVLLKWSWTTFNVLKLTKTKCKSTCETALEVFSSIFRAWREFSIFVSPTNLLISHISNVGCERRRVLAQGVKRRESQINHSVDFFLFPRDLISYLVSTHRVSCFIFTLLHFHDRCFGWQKVHFGNGDCGDCFETVSSALESNSLFWVALSLMIPMVF